MKKLFSILAFTAIMTSCNNSDSKTAAAADSARAAATSDSLAAIKALADTMKMPKDSMAKMMDTTMKAMPGAKDSMKK